MNNKNNSTLIKSVYSFLIAFIISIPIFAQQKTNDKYTVIEPIEIFVTYSLKYQKDSTNSNFINQEDMFLFLGQNTSLFMNADYYNFVTLDRQIGSAKLDNKLAEGSIYLPRTPFLYRIIKNYPSGHITCLEHVIGTHFRYNEKLNLFNWQLTSDTASIEGYKVQKATTNFGGRSWIAWFSPEIPYNDGPYTFNGLPGLILKIADTRNHYVFEMSSITKPAYKRMIDFENKDYVATTKQGFFQAQDAFREDIIERAKAAGLGYEAQQKMALNMAERNNPIELKRK